LFLREFMGWSYEDIAVFSNKSIGSVRTTLMRARRAFQARVEDVARRRGQWPLPVAIGGGWRRVRATMRSWRDSVSRSGSDAMNAIWRAEGVFGVFGSGLQAAVVAIAAAGTFAVAPAAAVATDGLGSAPAAHEIALAGATGALTEAGGPGRAAAHAGTGAGAGAREVLAVNHRSRDVAPDAPLETGHSIGETDKGTHFDGNVTMTVDDVPVMGDVGSDSHVTIPCRGSTIGGHVCQVLRDVPPPSR
jgi:hypothetical protein